MTARVLLLIAFILPWLSLFFLRKETTKRYMPVVILTALIMTIVFKSPTHMIGGPFTGISFRGAI